MRKDTSSDLAKWNISELSKAIASKEISPVEVMKDTLEQINSKNKVFNAFITILEKQALKEAQKAEEEIQKGNIKGALHGIPIALKDVIFTKGVRTTFGSERYKDFMTDYDAEVVTRLKNAGAIIVGKLNLQQWALGTTGDRSYFGPARNPHDPSKITGGSSSGAGASLASFMCHGAVGTDTGGSIRIPASACGIVGMKPTFGRVSKYGVMVLSWTLDHIGPMTRTVKDNAIMLNYMSGYDPKDPYSVLSKDEDFTTNIDQGVSGLTIGIPTSFYFDIIDPEVQSIFNKNVEFLRLQGAKIVDIDLPNMDEIISSQQIVLSTESYVALEKELQEAPEKIDDEVRGRLLTGITTQARDYIHMLQAKHLAIEVFTNALNKVDVIMTPTLCALPTEIEQREIDINGIKETPRIFARLTGPSNTTGLPSISVPGGFSRDGLPVGIQFIGAYFDENTLYRVAYAIEQS